MRIDEFILNLFASIWGLFDTVLELPQPIGSVTVLQIMLFVGLMTIMTHFITNLIGGRKQ